MARIAQRDYAFAVSGRGAAFFLALRALGLGSGDEMLLPESADFSLAAAVLHCGAVPVFCDLDPQTLCLSPAAAAARISGRVKGLAAVHMYGRTCDMDPLLALAAAHGLFVLEDAGTAVAALYRGRPAGSFGDMSVFGFNAPALPDCGGGVVLSSDRERMRRVALLGGEGRDASNPLVYTFPAYDFALSNLTAAAASAQVERLPELLGHKARIVGRYRQVLEDVPGLCLNPEDAETRNSCIMPLLITERTGAGGTARRLRERGIIARPPFVPLSSMPVFTKVDNPAAYAAADRALLLPGGCNLTDEAAEYVAACVKAVMRGMKALQGCFLHACGGRDAAPGPRPAQAGSPHRECAFSALNGAHVKTAWPAPPEPLVRKAKLLRRLAAIRKEGLELGFRHTGTEYLLRALNVDDLQAREITAFLQALWKENRHILFTARDPEADYKRQIGYLRDARDALLFMVLEREEGAGRPVREQTGAAPEAGRVFWGHAGLEDFDFRRESCRMDMLIMRAGAPRGLLAAACDRLFAWAREDLGIRRMFNHIAADNRGSRLLAASHGFTTLHRVSLRRHVSPTGTQYRPMLRPNREQPDAGLIISVKELGL
jgi:perosamine synthetase